MTTYYQSYKAAKINTSVITNKNIGSHCLSLIKDYLYSKGCQPFSTGNRGAYALALGDIPQVKEVCTIYPNIHQAEGIKEGDVIVFGTTASNQYGHTGLADETTNVLRKTVKLFHQDGFIDKNKDGVADGVAFEAEFPTYNITAILRPHWVAEENYEQKALGNVRGYTGVPDGNGNISWSGTTRIIPPPENPTIATPFFPQNEDKVEVKEQKWVLEKDKDKNPMIPKQPVNPKKETLQSVIGLLGGGGILSILNETEGFGAHIGEIHYFIMAAILLAVFATRLGVDDWLERLLNRDLDGDKKIG